MTTKREDYDEHIIDEVQCPHCSSHMVTGYLFKGTWIYVCEDCNFLGFEYRNKQDMENLKLFEKLRGTSVSKVMNYVLEDDETETGGTAFFGEKVRDFIEYGDNYGSVWELNKDLIACGIKPIEKFKNQKGNENGK